MYDANKSYDDPLLVYESPELVVKDLEPDYPVYCVRPAAIHRVARKFCDHFPGDVLYAVKCNPSRHMLNELYRAGIRHFDTASLSEIELISEMFDDGSAYFMHPIKSRSAIERAYYAHKVNYFVIDHPSEFEKISELIPPSSDVTLVVRVAVDNSGATYELSSKFGADLDLATTLVREVLEKGFRYGIAFHVGSQCLSVEGYETGLRMTAQILQSVGQLPSCIDIGGGFPAQYINSSGPDLEIYMDAIIRAIESLQLPASCRLFCEPGRALSAGGESLIVQIQLRKDNALYLNDGMYGNMIEEKYGLRLPVRVIQTRKFSSRAIAFTAYGPTCDALDIYPATLSLPSDIEEGDWIEFGQIGAYGGACRTNFNGFYSDVSVMVEKEFNAM
ncbi:MAG: ornithine decarboxylase [Acidiferrobacteraceae bacterium]|nr:ornithine decarboxylase [Acidiferrobacteraceae bacterium]|tara:strand:+ start:4735 stop:5901 length:1167 start_codon:yes stop_codon:yes gene_type:complete